MTGTTSITIHSGRLRCSGLSPELRRASTTLRRFSFFFFRCWGGLGPDFVAQPVGEAVEPLPVRVAPADVDLRRVEFAQEAADGFRPDLGHELVVALLTGP